MEKKVLLSDEYPQLLTVENGHVYVKIFPTVAVKDW
jgi:hypothetical protein